MKREIEVLSPGGSYESLKAAIQAGADAVYVGGSRFGARAFADNFNTEQLLEAIDYVHLHGKKIYLTVNTLLKQHELESELYDYLLPYYKQGIDAVIVQDMGVLQFVKKHFPDLPIHASTQMTVTNVLGAKFLERQGVERVVTAREMHIDEIREIGEQTELEIESFVHGALCYCYSGQCLYSSILGGRSGNRGQCAQPCRLPYQMRGERQQYLLSLKDICTLEFIPELVECGIHSFKIEGRMKKPEYVALVTAMYCKYVDLYFAQGKSGFSVDEKDKEKLMDLYNRGGFHGGYYHTQNGKEMISRKRPNHAGVPALKVMQVQRNRITAKALTDLHKGDVIELAGGKENYTLSEDVKIGRDITFAMHKSQKVGKNEILYRVRNEQLLQDIHREIIDQEKKILVDGALILSTKEPIKLILSCGNHHVEVLGEPAEEAKNQPLDAKRIENQMRKTGNTEFTFRNLDIQLRGNVFLPMQTLNQLRRDGLEALEQHILEEYRRKTPNTAQENFGYSGGTDDRGVSGFHIYVEEKEQFYVGLDSEAVKRIYLDANALDDMDMRSCIADAKEQGKEIYLAMPHILRKKTRRLYEEDDHAIIKASWDGILIRNLESYELLNTLSYEGNIVCDYNLYQFNRYTKEFWLGEKVEATTAPFELNYRELNQVGLEQSELIVYGHIPMMVSAQCIQKTTEGCTHRRGRLEFTDRYQKQFSVKNQCGSCYNVIYNADPMVLTDQYEEIVRLSPKALRLHFTLEDAESMKRVLSLYERVFVKEKKSLEPDMAFTRGHFKRGIK